MILRILFPAILVLCHCFSGVFAACEVKRCGRDFLARTKSLPSDTAASDGTSRIYCIYLNEYEKCVGSEEKSCFGDIFYHGIKTSVQVLVDGHPDCLKILSENPPDIDLSALNAGHLSSYDDPCGYANSKGEMTHCVMFGDPHMKTFNGSFMTCRVKGAWPLLSTAHLAVQVTNEPVGPGYKATATTKVTVLIKAKDGCSSAKTYEASSEAVPRAFVDGTTWTGGHSSAPSVWVEEAVPGKHVAVHVRHINATVGIRKFGRYLTVFATLPREVVSSSIENGDMQLCEGGCPPGELLQESPETSSTPAMPQHTALANCSLYNITDYYLDSCVFDLVTTGDLTFREAASMAQKDTWRGDPQAARIFFNNCTTWPCVWRVSSAGALPFGGCHLLVLWWLASLLFLVNVFS